MLARLSIRFKIVAVVSFMLVSLAAMGSFGLMQMRSINASTHEIQSIWLPGVQTLGDLRASTITYRVVDPRSRRGDRQGRSREDSRRLSTRSASRSTGSARPTSR